MITPDTDRPTETGDKAERLLPPKSFDQIRRETGSGGFISIGSVCGKVIRRTVRKRFYRHTLHAGR